MATVTIQPSSKDVFIDTSFPNTNYDGFALIQVEKTPSPSTKRGLCEFAVTWGTTIPNNANITAATLSLYYYGFSYTDPVGRTVDCNRMLRSDWVEGEATWNIYKTANSWTAAGCDSDGNDYTATAAVQNTVPASYGWMDWNVLTQVQWAQTNSAQFLFRLRFNNEASGNTACLWRSKEGVDPSLRPKLVITYSEVTPSVTTQAVTAISGTTATGNGNITTVGTATQHGHCWKVYVSDTSPPTIADSKTQNGVPAATGAFTSAMTGFVAGTKYGVRAYITNAEGTAYGAQRIFWADKGTVGPYDPVTRVSGIRRTFWAGQGGNAVSEMQINTGGISPTYIPLVGTREVQAAVPQEVPQHPGPILPTGPGYQESDYLQWVANTVKAIGISGIIQKFGHIPSYFEWARWMLSGAK